MLLPGVSPTLLVDGNNIAWRCFHAQRGLSSHGVPTGMAFEFLSVLQIALRVTRAERCCIAWDGGSPAFRLQLLPTYKNRGEWTEDAKAERREFYAQRDWLLQLLPLLGCHWQLNVGWEADDLLSLAVHRRNEPLVIYSGDRDLWQLVSERAIVLLPGKKGDEYERVTLPTFDKFAGTHAPSEWLTLRALSGDYSDKIPGIGRVGLTTARKIVAKPNWIATLTDTQRAVYARNRSLMDLTYSAGLLAGVLLHPPDGPPWQYGSGPRLALDIARKMMNEREMHHLTGAWSTWSRPFSELQL